MRDFDFSLTWYHGSQQKLKKLQAGSSISQNRDVAKAFSHRPSLVSMSDGTGSVSGNFNVKHNGVTPGYLYAVSEEIGPRDVHPHPHPVNSSRWEWLTNRELKLKLIARTTVTERETLTEEETAEIRRKQTEKGEETFTE